MSKFNRISWLYNPSNSKDLISVDKILSLYL